MKTGKKELLKVLKFFESIDSNEYENLYKSIDKQVDFPDFNILIENNDILITFELATKSNVVNESSYQGNFSEVNCDISNQQFAIDPLAA
jgi:hypothetical protein